MDPDSSTRPGSHQASGLEPPFHSSTRGIGPLSQNEFPRSVKHIPYPLEGVMRCCQEYCEEIETRKPCCLKWSVLVPLLDLVAFS